MDAHCEEADDVEMNTESFAAVRVRRYVNEENGDERQQNEDARDEKKGHEEAM